MCGVSFSIHEIQPQLQKINSVYFYSLTVLFLTTWNEYERFCSFTSKQKLTKASFYFLSSNLSAMYMLPKYTLLFALFLKMFYQCNMTLDAPLRSNLNKRKRFGTINKMYVLLILI